MVTYITQINQIHYILITIELEINYEAAFFEAAFFEAAFFEASLLMLNGVGLTCLYGCSDCNSKFHFHAK